MIGFGGRYGDSDVRRDVTVINVKPANARETEPDTDDKIECPLCGENVSSKNIVKSCSKDVEGHNVCRACHNNLRRDYFKGKSGCIYCGDRPSPNQDTNTINISITVRPEPQNVSVFVGNNNVSDCAKWCSDTMSGLIIVLLMIGIYILCCCVFHGLRWAWNDIIADDSDEDFDSSNISLSLLSAFLGFCFIFIIAAFIASAPRASSPRIHL